jgi:hypothetical protein
MKDQPVVLEKIRNEVKRALGLPVAEEVEAVPDQKKAAAATAATEKK